MAFKKKEKKKKGKKIFPESAKGEGGGGVSGSPERGGCESPRLEGGILSTQKKMGGIPNPGRGKERNKSPLPQTI